METFILILDIIGAIAFAYSGVIVAIKHKMDLLGVILLGCITACGGGVFRDILLFKNPSLFTIYPNWELISAFITTIVLFIFFYLKKNMSFFDKNWFKTLNTILDAIGLGVFVIMGANVAIDNNCNWFEVIFLATLTATGGGILRDLLALRIPVIFSRHIYAIAAILEAIIYYLLIINGANIIAATIVCVLLVVSIRVVAFKFKIDLPKVELNIKDSK
ncbi:MAG: trimeric intracellular cation channel family protein [Acholeplasmatales bacterium]|nr:trimeric intracellular cation channel family protein [Acholeplasmatales bacterium]